SAEDVTVKGQPAGPAYVIVTNNPEFANDDATGGQFYLFQGFRMDDFRDGIVDIETAMERYDKHRAIRRVLECVEEVQQLPASFSTVPNELLDGKGNPVSVPMVGEQMVYTRGDGTEGVGTITQILPEGDEAWVIVADVATRTSSILRMPLDLRP
ncbi:hypothetical protein AB4144_05505, partial [Rhizobiaceae sp. 2RAB30]